MAHSEYVYHSQFILSSSWPWRPSRRELLSHRLWLLFQSSHGSSIHSVLVWLDETFVLKKLKHICGTLALVAYKILQLRRLHKQLFSATIRSLNDALSILIISSESESTLVPFAGVTLTGTSRCFFIGLCREVGISFSRATFIPHFHRYGLYYITWSLVHIFKPSISSCPL